MTMRTKTQGPKMPKAPQSQAEKRPMPESLDESSIERASILDGEPHNSYGYPLHSTALEEDLRLSEEDAKAGEKVEKKGRGRARGLGKAAHATVAKQRPAASPRKQEEEKRGRKRKSVGEKEASGPRKDKGAAKENKKGRKLANRKSSSSQTPSPGPKRARTRKSSSSRSADRQRKLARKSSSSDGGAVHPVTQNDSPRGRPWGHGGADSSVVLDSFLSLCQTYKESVESTAVRRAIDTFSSTIKEQLTERITASKEIRVLKRDNAKVDSLIKRKTHKLLDAKYEWFRAEQQLGLLRKEKVELGQRVANLRRGLSFLHGIRDLTTRYLAHRHAHPAEKEQFGSSSLPALLLETKTILRAEDHLQNINNRLEARLRE